MNKKEQRYFYIYNLGQANYFISNGLVPIMVGKSDSGTVYIKFVRDEEAENIFTKWCNRKESI